MIYPYWFRSQFVSIRATSTQDALELMRISVQGKRNDERGHNQMFRQMYRELTGHEVTEVSNEQAKLLIISSPSLHNMRNGPTYKNIRTATRRSERILTFHEYEHILVHMEIRRRKNCPLIRTYEI